MPICPLAHDPVACLKEKQRRHLPLKYRTHIECDYCEYAYSNAVIAHVPEPDDMEPRLGWGGGAEIDPNDFLEQPPKRNGPKPKDVCSKGHPRATFGVLRKDGRWRCKICDSARYKKKYKEKKEAA